jgi:hypothetical protein
MKRTAVIIFASLFLFCRSVQADPNPSPLQLYAGAGFDRSTLSLKTSGTESNFVSWGGRIVAGVELKLGTDVKTFIEGEYGRAEGFNTYQTTSYIEKLTNNYLSAKAGFSYSNIALGGGARQNQIDIDNVQSGGGGLRSSYKGLTYFGFGQLIFVNANAFRTIVEAQYGGGSLDTLEMNETSVSLRLVFFPFSK